MKTFSKENHRTIEHIKQDILELHDNDDILMSAISQAKNQAYMEGWSQKNRQIVEQVTQRILGLSTNKQALLLAIGKAKHDILTRMAVNALCPPAKDGELHE